MKRSSVVSASAIGVAALVVAVAVRLLAGSFAETFSGTPAAAVPFTSASWAFSVVSTNSTYGDALGAPDSNAQHGPACQAPGENGTVTHTVNLFADLVYQCADHVMTHLNDDQYQALEMTPNQLVDLTGPATVKFDVSTLPRSTRDWIDVWIQDPATQEADPLDSQAPTAQGNPRNALHIGMVGSQVPVSQDVGNRAFRAEVYDSNRQVTVREATAPGWMSVLPALSAQTRRTIQVDFTRAHVKVWMPEFNLVWVDADIPQLPFTEGVVSFGHHSYSPHKGNDPVAGGGADTGVATSWHWDNMTISPSIPFEIIHSDHRSAQYNDTTARTFTLEKPAPANSVLRFTAHGDGLKVHFNGGPAVDAIRSGAWTGQGSTSYLMPVPIGTTTLTFDVTAPVFGFVGAILNPTVFAFNGAVPPPTASPTASPTPTVTPTPVPAPCRAYVRNAKNTGWVYDISRGSYQGILVAGECRR